MDKLNTVWMTIWVLNPTFMFAYRCSVTTLTRSIDCSSIQNRQHSVHCFKHCR